MSKHSSAHVSYGRVDEVPPNDLTCRPWGRAEWRVSVGSKSRGKVQEILGNKYAGARSLEIHARGHNSPAAMRSIHSASACVCGCILYPVPTILTGQSHN